jgi:hypothetical protein
MPRPKIPIMFVSRGAGMTDGLELWKYGPKIILVDRSPDGRFKADVETWNGGLNAVALKKIKDAAKQNPT